MSRLFGRPVMHLALLVVTAVAAVACGTGGPPEPSPAAAMNTAAPGSSAPASTRPQVTASASVAAAPTAVPTPATAAPPAALLSGAHMSGEPQVGSLGSYTWGDQGSDSPWIIPRADNEVNAGTPLDVSLDAAMTPAAWTARWAPVAAGAAGDVASSQDGSGSVSLVAPDATGDWSLQLEARFGNSHSAVWYWRITVR